MAITLDPTGPTAAITLPDGLIWDDELAWQPGVQSSEYALGGGIVIDEGRRTSGRPITLFGGRTGTTSWAWMKRSALLTLKTAIDAAGATFTLTLHDARTFSVRPRRSDGPALDAFPLPIVGERAPADPDSDSLYVIERIRLIEA